MKLFFVKAEWVDKSGESHSLDFESKTRFFDDPIKLRVAMYRAAVNRVKPMLGTSITIHSVTELAECDS